MKLNLTLKEEQTIAEDYQLFGTYLIWKYGFEPKQLMPKSSYHSHKKSLLEHGIDISTYRPNIEYEFFASPQEQHEAAEALEMRKMGTIYSNSGPFGKTKRRMTQAELDLRDIEDNDEEYEQYLAEHGETPIIKKD